VSLASGQFKQALEQGSKWLTDQFFSRQPAIFASYVSSLMEDYDGSISMLRQSLKVNPKDPVLVNNLAFALASNNQVDDAIGELKSIDYASVSGTVAITSAATYGLWLFRTGQHDQGRKYYRLAIQKAEADSDPRYRLNAALYLAREELLARTDVAHETAKKALDAASKSDLPEVALVARQVRKLVDSVQVGEQRG